MEKFNLERALAGEPVITRNGKEVTQLVKFDTFGTTYVVGGVVDGDVKSWTIDGKHYDKQLKLFMKPKENAIWVNVYKRSDGALVAGHYYDSEAKAKEKSLGRNYIKTVKITEL
jgi:hypothetical protein